MIAFPQEVAPQEPDAAPLPSFTLPVPDASGRFPSVHLAHRWAKAHLGNPELLTPEEIAALREWRDSSVIIQLVARGSTKWKGYFEERALWCLSHLDSSVACACLPHPITVYRIVSAPFAPLDNGSAFCDPGYTSTSLSSHEPKRLACLFDATPVFVTIRLPEGQPALYVDGILQERYQHEVLLPRHTPFRMLSERHTRRQRRQEWEAVL